jgi:hypothetical protein
VHRERVVDDHMFAVERDNPYPGTFRLQLFTAPDMHPVAVVIQANDEGASLVNAGEHYAAEVWRRHLPDHPEPPIWVQRQLLEGFDFFELVTFTKTGPYALTDPEWSTLTYDEVTQLVGQPVDPTRGDGYVPRPEEPEEQLRYDIAWVARLPRPRPFREKECMSAGTPWWQRIGRQLFPRHVFPDCCWYHSVDWRQVSKVAVRFVRQAQREGVAEEKVTEYVLEHAKASGMTRKELNALDTLTSPGIGIHVSRHAGLRRRTYINGQHRAQAMLDAGVRRTIVIRYEMPSVST